MRAIRITSPGSIAGVGPLSSGARDPYTAYRDAAALYLLDAARTLTFTLGGAGGSISEARDALGGSIVLAGGGLLLSGGTVQLSSSTPTADLVTTSAGPAGGAAHTIHALLDVASIPSDFGAIAMVGRRNTHASPIGTRNAANGYKGWWGNFEPGVGLKLQTVAGLTVPGKVAITVTYDAGVFKAYIDGVFDSSTTSAITWSQGLAIGTLHNTVPGPNASLARAAFFSAALTKAQINALIASDVRALSAYRTAPFLRTDGDSITRGYGLSSPTTESWPAIATALIDADRVTPIVLSNGGVDSSYVDASLVAGTAAYRPRSERAVCTIGWGSNNIFIASQSASTVIGALTSAVASARAAGYQPVGVTILPRGSIGAPGSTVAETVNAWWRSTSGCPVIDAAALPHAADPTSAVYYQDTTHPTAALAAEIGALAATVLAPMLA